MARRWPPSNTLPTARTVCCWRAPKQHKLSGIIIRIIRIITVSTGTHHKRGNNAFYHQVHHHHHHHQHHHHHHHHQHHLSLAHVPHSDLANTISSILLQK